VIRVGTGFGIIETVIVGAAALALVVHPVVMLVAAVRAIAISAFSTDRAVEGVKTARLGYSFGA
jgi:hypothetical protein